MLLTLKQVAACLGRHPKSVERLIREGKFPRPIPVMGRARWRSEWVLVAAYREEMERILMAQSGAPAEHFGTSAPEGQKGASQRPKRD